MHRLANPPVGAGEGSSLPDSIFFARLFLLHVAVALLLLLLQSLSLIVVGFHLLLAVLGRVGALVEAGEQKVEHEGVRTDKVREGNREVAVVLEEQLEGMDHHEHKLNLLRIERREKG